MKYRFIEVTAVFNTGAVSETLEFDTFGEMEEYILEQTAGMSAEDAEEYMYNSQIIEVEGDES